MTTLVFDIDYAIFDAVSVAQETFITATHLPTSLVMKFDNRTALWGHHGKKEGGWIGIQNKMSGNDYYKSEDFEVVDGVVPRPFRIKGIEGSDDTFVSPESGAKQIIDEKIIQVCAKLKTNTYIGFTGTGEVFRHELATLLPYKGNREGATSPLLLGAMKQYVQDAHNTTLVTGKEADDAVAIYVRSGYRKWLETGDDADKVIGIAIDKDSKQTEGFWYNPNKDTEVREVKQGLGSLWLDAKGEVDGDGRMWLYFQIAVGDTTDNYKSNCFSTTKWAGKSGYAALKDCTTDKEAFIALVAVFKKLYPEPIEVDGCKGRITIDWLHVFQEMATMAMMERWDGDRMDVKGTLDKLGIAYGD